MKSLVFTAFYKNFSVIKTLLYFKTHLKTAAKPINTGLTAVFNLLNCQRRDYEFKNVDSKATQDLNAYKITDMAGATPEHSAVIVNFVAAIRHQLKNSTCYVYSDNVQYRFKDNQGNNKIVIPDASINCRTKSRRGNTFTLSRGIFL